ncbi:hypothetical protein TWF694_003179 [Orbilia ellipsospora]|uniref:NACHT domain-containing protein n=1 Tax=Orbilia ellipsospora TaxID=2528407 RepID=A0AAV9X211_9PEZI
MDPLSVIASTVTLIEVAGKSIKYALDVKGADEDVRNLKQQAEELSKLIFRLKLFLENPQNSKIKSLATTEQTALEEWGALLKSTQDQLKPFSTQVGEKKRWRDKFSGRARQLKWPFTKKEFERVLAQLEKVVDKALQIEQFQVILDIDQDKNLSKLLVSKGAAFGSFEDQHQPECLPNTRTDLLEDLKKWVADPTAARIFWLYGMAGTGKSTISRTLARSLANNKQLAASFFFKRGDANRDSSRFFSTIAVDLIAHIPRLGPLVSQAIEGDTQISRKALGEQFDKLILQPLSALPPKLDITPPSVIVLDALDECDDARNANLLVELLVQLQTLNNIDVRIFITSRPEIQPGLDEIANGKYKELILHDIQQPTIKHDIAVFLRHQFEIIRKSRNMPKDWPGDDAIQSVTDRATPLFIFASVVCRFVAEKRFPAQERLDLILGVQKAKNSFTSKIDAIYGPVLNQLIIDMDKLEEEALLLEFKNIVGTIILVETPLSRRSLSQLITISESRIQCILDPLRSVINTPDDIDETVKVFHQSFPDFLLDENRKGEKFAIHPRETHKILFRKCLELLAKSLKEDICDLKEPGIFLADIPQDCIELKIPPSVHYACRFWVHHFKQAETSLNPSDVKVVEEYLRTNLLYWLEAISILGYSFNAVYLIQDLEASTQRIQVSILFLCWFGYIASIIDSAADITV